MSTPQTTGPVLITGCSSGIGRALARHLAQAGYTVYASARRAETLADLAALGCRTLALDVTSEASMVAAVQQIEAEHGAVGVLVNNAGYGEYGVMEEVSIVSLRRQFETNVFGAVRLCQLVLPAMRARRTGRILNIGSMGGQMTFPVGGAYHASKYAMEAISDAMRVEVAPFGIQVALVQPAYVTTEFVGTVQASEGVQAQGASASPYAGLIAAFDKALKRSYQGAFGPTVSADDVAGVIVRAIASPTMRPRYQAGLMAVLNPLMRRWLTDRGWDWFMRRAMPWKPAG
jgi:NAD(P)-dependent dehydrogenase (short-subunit alcohol dehydrogenase family)